MRATMMTDDLDCDERASKLRDGSPRGVEGYMPMSFSFSSARMCRVAVIPSITGSWMSICD